MAKDPRAIDLENGYIHISEKVAKDRRPRACAVVSKWHYLPEVSPLVSADAI